MLLKILGDGETIVGLFEMDYFFKIGNFLNGKCSGTAIRIELDKKSVFLDGSKSASIIFKELIFEKHGNVLLKY